MLMHFLNFADGLVTDLPIHLVSDGALTAMSNVNSSYKLGALLKRPGYEIIGAALEANKSITGLHNFRQSATVQKMLATVNNSGDTALQLFYSTGGVWTELTDAETAWSGFEDAKVEMEDFIGYCFFVGYDATDGVFLPNRTLTGTTFGTTNTTSMPGAKFIKRYRDRLYVAHCFETSLRPFRVYHSSVPAAGVISWTVASDFFDVDYSEEVTGLEQNWDRLVVFTEYSAYMYNQTEFKKVWDIGCSNHRTIKNSGATMIWANQNGVWMSTGGRPENIAGPVIDFIRTSNMTTSFAEVVGEEYHLYIGNPVVNGITYSNASLVFNIPTQTWRVVERFDTATVFAKFYSAGQDSLWMGNTVGSVHRQGKYTDATLLKSDAGKPISVLFQTKAYSFGDPASEKEIAKIFTYSQYAQGLQLKARVVDRNSQALTPFKPLGQLSKYINEFQVNPSKGNFIQFEGTENSSNSYFSFYGFSCDVKADVLAKS